MELGLMLPTVGGADPSAIFRIARLAEEAGLGSVWVPDHVVLPAQRESVYPYPQSHTERAFVPGMQWLDPVASMGAVAAVTERVRIGTAVLVLPLRVPLVLANEISSLDRLSGGRIDLGVGVGWLAEEFEALGREFATRGRLTDEAIEAMRLLWRSSEPCSYAGEHVRFDDVVLGCPPAQRGGPPLWVGGHTRPAMRRAVGLGDGWHGFEVSLEEMKGYRETLDALCTDAGRDPTSLRVGIHKSVVPPFEAQSFLPERPALQGMDALEDLRAFAALGVDLVVCHLHFMLPDVERALEWMGAELVPAAAEL